MTSGVGHNIIIGLHFNSHAHVERDHHVELTDGGKYNFNSHAHVERDQTCRRSSMDIGNFNSHAHVERDKFAELTASTTGISTHTLTWSVTGNPV